jgi:predicted outer membrane repeat protein
MSPEQIRMARRFVSDFVYKTDTTFNTNILKLLLSVLVGINNTSSTFLIAYCYITSELAVSFKWISKQLTDLAFSDCLEPALIISNFSKGLGAAIATKATANLEGITLTDKVLS